MVEQLPLKRQIARVRVLAIRIIVTKVLGLSVENPHRLVFTTEQYCIRAMYIIESVKNDNKRF